MVIFLVGVVVGIILQASFGSKDAYGSGVGIGLKPDTKRPDSSGGYQPYKSSSNSTPPKAD